MAGGDGKGRVRSGTILVRNAARRRVEIGYCPGFPAACNGTSHPAASVKGKSFIRETVVPTCGDLQFLHVQRNQIRRSTMEKCRVEFLPD